MSEKLVIAVLAGTTRENRESIKAAKLVAEHGRTLPDVEIVFVDPLELNLPSDGDEIHDTRYTEITAHADAFYIVTPEYNHSFPGSLKRMLDSEFDNYFHKPVALAGVSSGPWGGVRVCEALLPVMHTMAMPVIKHELYFPKVATLFDENGQLKPEHQERYTKSIGEAYAELVWMATALKAARP